MERADVYKMIDTERAYQNSKWGDEFDNANTPNDWVAYIAIYLGRAVTLPWNRDAFRTAILKVAALAVAVLERDEYAPRSSDEHEYASRSSDYAICPECGSPDPNVHYIPQDVHQYCENFWHRRSTAEHTAC
jgi:hypothetical protein